MVTDTINPSSAFNETLTNLDKLLKDFKPLIPPVDSMTNVVVEIDDLLNALTEMIQSATIIDDIVIVLGDVLEFLDGIPIVGEIAAVMGGIVETIGDTIKEVLTTAQEVADETIKPIEDFLNEVKSGLVDIRTVVVDISQKVPGYINTVQILSYLAEIAAPLSNVLEGTEPGKRVEKVLNEFLKVQKDLGTAINVINPVLTVADTAIKDLTKVLNAITNAMGTGIQDVLDDIKSAVKFFQPISNGFQKLEHAIKPLAWVLDALACIFNKILKPVIDAILKATGLDALVKKAEKTILDKIGIGPVLDMAKSSMNPKEVSTAGQGIDSSSGQQGQSDWSSVSSALGIYRSSKTGGTKAAIWGLVNSITGGNVDPNKPYVAPPFQPVPNILPVSSGTKNFYSTVRRNIFDKALIDQIRTPQVRFYAQAIILRPEIIQLVEADKIDPDAFPNSAKLVSDIYDLSTKLNALNPAAAKLHTALNAFEESLVLPTTFGHQVNDLNELFIDSANILNFFEIIGIEFVNKLVDPIVDILKTQQRDCALVSDVIPALKKAILDIDSASQAIISAVPQTKVICDAIHRLDGWGLVMQQTIKLISEAQSEVASLPKDKQIDAKNQIVDVSKSVEDIAEVLLKRVDNMSNQTAELTTAIRAIQTGLNKYTVALTAISDASDLISDKGLKTMDEVNHILSIANSIVDPLSGLLQATKCVDSSSPAKEGAAISVDMLKRAGTKAVTNDPSVFEKFVEQLSEKVLPLGQLTSKIKIATDTLSNSVVLSFTSNSSTLANSLKQLTAELKYSESYQVTIPIWKSGKKTGATRQVTINNDFFSSCLLAKAQNLVKVFGAQGINQ